MIRAEESIARQMLDNLGRIDEWMNRAACKNSDLDPMYKAETEDFKALCRKCPVIEECRAKYTEFNENVRPINNGVFHAVDYREKG